MISDGIQGNILSFISVRGPYRLTAPTAKIEPMSVAPAPTTTAASARTLPEKVAPAPLHIMSNDVMGD